MCHNPMTFIILGSVPQSYEIVAHQFGTKFWKKVLGCLAFLFFFFFFFSIFLFQFCVGFILPTCFILVLSYCGDFLHTEIVTP
jgi:hypothetical protein